MKKSYLTPITLLVVLAGLLVSPSPVAAAPPAGPGPWWGDYFDNADLGGAPAMSRYDDDIKFSWGDDGPGAGIPADYFSARWVRDEWFAGGTYRFEIIADDGVRIWVGEQLVVDEWREHWAVPFTVDQYILAGVHRVRVEYFEHAGDATISVNWKRLVGGATWYGEYFDNRNLDGWPALVRNDRAVDFDWGTGSPDPAVPGDNFSVRWTHTLEFDAGNYRFLASADDGVRVLVDGAPLIDAWHDQKMPNRHTADVYLEAGQHSIIVEYYEHGDKAAVRVWWKPLDSFSGWRGEYFDNRDFAGSPVLVRDDDAVDFDWGVGPPVDWMTDDNFAVRWTRTVNFTPGYYRFVTQADDGVRLWINQYPIIDKWQDMDYELHYVDGCYMEGEYTITIEYYEHGGSARVRAWWEPGTNDDAPPASVSAVTDAGAAPEEDDPWVATYFANTSMSGEPVLTRIETALDHDWGWGSPGAGVPQDHFSARWTQSLYFAAGTYRFTTYTDDGVQLWVDGRLVINSWRPMRGYRSTRVWLSEGIHEVRMDYYERTGVALARLEWQRISR